MMHPSGVWSGGFDFNASFWGHQQAGWSGTPCCDMVTLLLLQMVRSCEHLGQEMNYTSGDGQKTIQ